MAGTDWRARIGAWALGVLVAMPCALVAHAASGSPPTAWDELGRLAADKADLIDAYQQLHVRHWDGPESTTQQWLSMTDAMVGRYAQAQQEMYRAFETGPVPVPACPCGLGSGSFGQWLSGHAGAYDLVMINEAHNQPMSRALIYQVLPAMRAQGFSILALEALPDPATTDAINRDGFVRDEAGYGFYLREPIEAAIVRQARRLGFTLANYDTFSTHREQDEASHLARILRDHPHQKVFVVAGYDHIRRTEGHMAALLSKVYSKPFLSIDQLDKKDFESNDVLRDTCMPADGAKPSGKAATLASMRWMPGGLGSDVTVMRTGIYANQRAGGIGREWLTLGGARHRYHFDAGACARRGPCLVEARHEEEPASAAPADRYLALKGGGAVDLYLPDGRYVLTYRNAGGVVRVDRLAAMQGTIAPLGADPKQARPAAALSGREGGKPQ